MLKIRFFKTAFFIVLDFARCSNITWICIAFNIYFDNQKNENVACTRARTHTHS